MSIEEEVLRLVARKYALLNATSHDGKAERGAVVGRIMSERADLRGAAKQVSQIVSSVLSEVNGLTLEEQLKALEIEFPESSKEERLRVQSKKDSDKSKQLPELPGAMRGEVTTRFPPEPNGYMHIGHAKASILGNEYAKMYGGKFILRFDDTNPSAEKKEYYDAFLDSFRWLEISPSVIRNSSDDMEKFYSLAEKMLRSGKAYICSCSQDRMKELRAIGEACEHRTRDFNESLTLWREMLSRELRKNEATLRFRGDIASPNTAMRDPVLFRIVEEAHPLLDSKYVVWPTYDFAGPVEDSLDGVTHAMRSKEYELRDEVYDAILGALDLRIPMIIEFSRLRLQDTTLSKRGLSKLVKEGLVSGWDDPRLATISGLRRRGFLPQAIRDFVLSMGLSKVESQPTWDLLESFNRKLLDPISKRYFFVPEPICLLVEGAPNSEVSLKNHPDNPDLGKRIVEIGDSFYIPRSDAHRLAAGSKFRLIEALNAEVTEVGRDLIRARYLEDSSSQDISKVQWVARGSEFPLTVLVPGPLLVRDEFNPESMQVVKGVAESAVESLYPGEIIQFPRFGFCRIDSRGMAIRAHK